MSESISERQLLDGINTDAGVWSGVAGMSRNKLRECLRTLEDIGVFTVMEATKSSSRIFVIAENWITEMGLRPRKADKQVQPLDEGGTTVRPQQVQPLDPKEKKYKNSNIKKTKYSPDTRRGRKYGIINP